MWGGIALYNSQSELILSTFSIMFVPITGSVWWYATAYIVMMLIAPSYNRLLDKFNRKGMNLWIAILLVFGYTLGNFGSNFHDLEVALLYYTIGVYFRDYVNESRGKKEFVLVLFIGVVLNGLFQYGISTFALSDASYAVIIRKAFSMVTHLIAEPAACIGLFGLFSTLTIHSKKINIVAGHTFGVYLLHEAPPIRNLIWIHLLQPWKHYGKISYFIYVIFCVSIVFFVGCIIDTCREKILEESMNTAVNKVIARFKKIGFKE